jgi:hypothetical protein
MPSVVTEGSDFSKVCMAQNYNIFLMGVELYRATDGAVSVSIQGPGPGLISLRSQISGKPEFHYLDLRCI